jgi:hypothetical protein
VLHTTPSAIVQVGADARRQLKALIITTPEPLRDTLRGRSWLQQARACAALVAVPTDPVEHRATARALRVTAERVLAARFEARELEDAASGPSWADQGLHQPPHRPGQEPARDPRLSSN